MKRIIFLFAISVLLSCQSGNSPSTANNIINFNTETEQHDPALIGEWGFSEGDIFSTRFDFDNSGDVIYYGSAYMKDEKTGKWFTNYNDLFVLLDSTTTRYMYYLSSDTMYYLNYVDVNKDVDWKAIIKKPE